MSKTVIEYVKNRLYVIQSNLVESLKDYSRMILNCFEEQQQEVKYQINQ